MDDEIIMEDIIIFRKPELSDIYELENNFNDCPFIEDFKDDINNNKCDDIRILIINGEIVGIAKFYKDCGNIYYIEMRCTKDRPENSQRPSGLKTHGRLLWAYILHEINSNYRANRQNANKLHNKLGRTPNNKFIVYNVPLTTARAYHEKMGMKRASAIIMDQTTGETLCDYITSIANQLNDDSDRDIDSLDEDLDIYYDMDDDTNLFYIQDPKVNYDSINEILRSITPPSNERIIFRTLESADINELENNFKDCPFTDRYTTNFKDKTYDSIRVLIINGEIVGIAKFYNIWPSQIYYIETRCTKDKPENFQRGIGLKTPGRLLWAYILREINLLHVRNGLKKNRFVVFNIPRRSTRGYHLKMGMNAASQIKIDEKRNLRDIVFPSFKKHKESLNNYNASIFNDRKPRDDDYLLKKFDEKYMFYLQQLHVNYYSIDSILKSLPSPSDGTIEAVAERNTVAETEAKETEAKETEAKETEVERNTEEGVEAAETEVERKATGVAAAEAAETEDERKTTGVAVGGIKTKNKKTKNRKTKNRKTKNRKTKNKKTKNKKNKK